MDVNLWSNGEVMMLFFAIVILFFNRATRSPTPIEPDLY